MTTARWKSLPQGRIGAAPVPEGMGPLLVWAEATQYRDFLRDRAAPRDLLELPIICELAAEASVGNFLSALEQLGGRTPEAYTNLASNRHCTAVIPREVLPAFLERDIGRMVKRFEIALPVIPTRPRPLAGPEAPNGFPTRMRSEPGKTTLLGVIDSGCPFAHSSLRDGFESRFLAIWDQDQRPGFATAGGICPQDFGYGAEVNRSQIGTLLAQFAQGDVVDEDACYRAVGLPALMARVSHGAAVLDLLAGPRPLASRLSHAQDLPPTWAPINDEARQADLVFVDLPRDGVQDSSSGGLARWILDGLRYICSCAGQDTTRIVVNISNGTSRSTHDGSSIIEQAMVALIEEQRNTHHRDLHIVIAAGNDRDEERHAQVALSVPSKLGSILLRVPPGSEAPTWVTVRVPAGAEGLKLWVRAPREGQQSDWVGSGDACALYSDDPSAASAGIVYPKHEPAGSATALITIAPTAGFGSETRAAPGDWEIGLESEIEILESVHFYICRNQLNPGALRRGRQARFVSDFDEYDPDRWRRKRDFDPQPANSPIRRAATLNGLATSPTNSGLVVVGSVMQLPMTPTTYSSVGPSGGCPAKSGAPSRAGPDCVAVTDVNRNLPGIMTAGSRSGARVRMVGTSFAAPQIARKLANGEPLPNRSEPDALTGSGASL